MTVIKKGITYLDALPKETGTVGLNLSPGACKQDGGVCLTFQELKKWFWCILRCSASKGRQWERLQ